eukprot:scaffold1401_cov330-Pavlova_lutheri.AAC.119
MFYLARVAREPDADVSGSNRRRIELSFRPVMSCLVSRNVRPSWQSWTILVDSESTHHPPRSSIRIRIDFLAGCRRGRNVTGEDLLEI